MNIKTVYTAKVKLWPLNPAPAHVGPMGPRRVLNCKHLMNYLEFFNEIF